MVEINSNSEIVNYYQSHFDESVRLKQDDSEIELVRTQDIISRYLPKPPAKVLDVGGGAGVYSAWLAKLGYSVQLIDIVPKHIEKARALSESQPNNQFSSDIGDATRLKEDANSQDLVLELGPLYHLPEKPQRIIALTEAWRVLKPDGIVIVAAISRHTSLFSGLLENVLEEDDFNAIVERDLLDGKHLPDTPKYFTTAYFHRSEELSSEVQEAGFALKDLLAVEGPFWLLKDLPERWQNPKSRRQLLYALGKIEKEPTIMGASLHILAIGQKLI
jgi:2-polyprenyl-3-methyl-5-hydroxy-6-metoxy-1,4-benzoquinol methylase